jgi:O-antigen/teichoic acid export membrane protein
MTMESPHRQGLIARNSIFNLLGQILPMLVGILTIPYIVRGIGTDGYGILSIAWMVLGYFSVFDLGLSRATVKFVAEHLSPDKINKVPELVWTSLGLLFLLGCAGGLFIAAFVPMSVTHFFKMPLSFVGEARTALYILAASMPVILANDAIRGVLEATQRFDLVNYVKVPASICFYLAAALAIPLGIGVVGIVALLVFIRLATAIIYLALCFRVIPSLRTTLRFSREALGPLSVYGGWIMVSNITGPIFGYLERFLIASVLSVGTLTFYAAPFDLVSKVIIFPASITPALFPYFSYHGARSRAVVSDTTSRSLKYLLLVMTPVIATFVFFAREILQLWLGTQFANQSTVVMQIIALAFFLNVFAMVPFTSVQALGRPDLKAILDVIALPTYAIVCWLLMRRMGINGAAFAKLFITVVDCTFLFAFARRLKAFAVRDCVSGSLGRTILLSGGVFIATFLIQALHARIVVSFLLLGLCFGLYLWLFWFLAAGQNDKDTIQGLFQELRAGGHRRERAAVVQASEAVAECKG